MKHRTGLRGAHAPWALLVALGSAQAESRLTCGAELELAIAATNDLVVIVADAGFVRIRERDVDLEWAIDAGPATPAALRPPRLGETWVSVHAGARLRLRAPQARSEGRASLGLHCGELPAVGRCVARLELALGKPAPAKHAADIEDRECAALDAHDQANRHSASGSAEASRERYLVVARRWRELGQADRAAAALLGVAEQSAHTGRNHRTLFEAYRAEIANRRAGNRFYAARALQTAAVAAGTLGFKAEADILGEVLLRRYARLQAWNEWANVQYNLGVGAIHTGDDAAARSRLQQIEALDPSLLQPIARGRAAYLRMSLALREGRLREAIQAADEAEASLAVAGQKGHLVASYRVLADLHRMLGLHAEGLHFLRKALSSAPPMESPQRTARVLWALADIAGERGDLRRAQAMLYLSEAVFRKLGLVFEAGWTRAERLRIEWRRKRDAATILAASQDIGTEFTAPLCAIRAEAEVALGRPAKALAFLESAVCRPGTLDMVLDQASARAQALAALGHEREAREQLLHVARNVGTTSHDSGMTLEYAVRRRLSRLHEAWIASSAGAMASDMLQFVLATHAHTQGWTRQSKASGSASAAIGRALLADTAASSAEHAAAADQLVTTLARPAIDSSRDAPIRIEDVQAGLAREEWMLLWLTGGHSGRALWISSDRVQVSELPGRGEMQSALAALHAALAGPRASPATAAERARELSGLLFAGAPTRAAPRRLQVLTNQWLASAPLAMLTWPGEEQPLVAGTDISWITSLSRVPPAHQHNGLSAPSLQVFVAAEPGGARAQLPALPFADTEPGAISAARPELSVVARRAGAAELLAALQLDNGFIHVAAHGLAQADHIGYSGVWLAPGGEPQFLSWIDVVDQRVRARLAVFNACQLGSAPGVDGQLGFATAVSAAGVENVIAASWQTSDAATRVWVPAFYRALNPAHPESSAAALRAAQLALRDSPHFRHPWYWASLAHYQRLELPAAGALPAQRP